MADPAFTCPRRAESPLGASAPESDVWRPWSARWGGQADYFPPGFDPPRTCSYCGSAHPEDTLRLLTLGWDNEKATGKNYKGYLHVPGFLVAINAAHRRVADGEDVLVAYRHLPKEPTPPIKFYTPHFSASQLVELNALVRSAKKRGPDA